MRTSLRNHLLCIVLGPFAGAMFTGPVGAQSSDFPTKPIRIVVPNTAGSLSDLIPRVMGPEMAKTLGQSVIVEVRPGAGQLLGLEYVAKRVPADGHTVVITAVPTLATLPFTVKDLKFDPAKDLPPFSGVLETTLYLGSSAQFPWKTLQELVANARANPGKLNFAAQTGGVRLYCELLNQQFGTTMTYIPYSSSGPMDLAVMSGDVHFAFLGDGQVKAMGPKIRVLALSSAARKSSFPNSSTFAELGLPLQSVLYSFHAPAGTPKIAMDRLYDAASKALLQDEVRASFIKIESEIVNLPPDAVSKRMAETATLYGGIAKKIGLQPE